MNSNQKSNSHNNIIKKNYNPSAGTTPQSNAKIGLGFKFFNFSFANSPNKPEVDNKLINQNPFETNRHERPSVIFSNDGKIIIFNFW